MASERPISARSWRDRAEEARALAAQMQDPQARAILLEIAATYEMLARRVSVRAGASEAEEKE